MINALREMSWQHDEIGLMVSKTNTGGVEPSLDSE